MAKKHIQFEVVESEHDAAKAKAAQQDLSLSQYMRRLLRKDLGRKN